MLGPCHDCDLNFSAQKYPVTDWFELTQLLAPSLMTSREVEFPDSSGASCAVRRRQCLPADREEGKRLESSDARGGGSG
jgi:hypothetical protein